MEVLFAFSFEDGLIFETKNTLLPQTAPKHEKFQWKLVSNNDTTVLDFSSRTDTTRSFTNGIHLDLEHLLMSYNDRTYKLTNVKDSISLEMEDVIYSSGNIAGFPQFIKSILLDIYTKANENVESNIESLQKIPNIVELTRSYFLSCLNSQVCDETTLHCLSSRNDIPAFCFIQYKGILNGKPCYKLSSLTVNVKFKGFPYGKRLIDNIIQSFPTESGFIYSFVPKAFEGADICFNSLYKHNELTTSPENFPEDPTAWLDENGKIYLPLDSWNCFWYPKNPSSQ